MKKKPFFTKKQVIVPIVVFFSVGLLGWGGWVLIEPHPLGNNEVIKYMGRRAYGQIPLLSDSNPGTTYYYATDLAPLELAAQFQNASSLRPNELEEWQQKGPNFPMGFKLNHGGGILASSFIEMDQNKQIVSALIAIKSTSSLLIPNTMKPQKKLLNKKSFLHHHS